MIEAIEQLNCYVCQLHQLMRAYNIFHFDYLFPHAQTVLFGRALGIPS
jgi:hypothetical protein